MLAMLAYYWWSYCNSEMRKAWEPRSRLTRFAVMAALKKGDKGEADRLMGKSEQMNDSLIPGMGKLKAMFLGRKKDGEQK